MNLEIVNKVKNALVIAGSSFTNDQKDAYQRAILNEKNDKAKWVLENLLDNACVAESRRSPLCDDTGIPHLFLEIGRSRSLSGEIFESIYEGINQGLRELPGRPMAVRGNDLQRLDQSAGLYDDSGMLAPAPLVVKLVDGDIMRLHILMLGGGPAIRGITKRVFHKHNVETVVDEIVSRAIEGVKMLGCTPCVLAIGVGRSQFEASAMMMEAMVFGNFNEQSELEKKITERINAVGPGPLGLGGETSVLATFMKIGPQRASGVRIVSIRPCCCMEPRRSYLDL